MLLLPFLARLLLPPFLLLPVLMEVRTETSEGQSVVSVMHDWRSTRLLGLVRTLGELEAAEEDVEAGLQRGWWCCWPF